MQKKLIGKLLTFKFTGRKTDISGVVLAYNDNWTLVRRFYNDYSFDGFTIFKNEKVDYYYGDFEKMATKILKLKKYSFKNEPVVPIESLEQILEFITKKYKLLELATKRDDSFDVVRFLKKSGSVYIFDELTTKAKWRYKLRLPEKECSFISFDDNYSNALRLLTKFK